MSFLWFLILGALAGWIAGEIMKGRGFGLLGNIVVGIIGALIGGFLFRTLGVSPNNFLGSLITAVVGAVILLLIVGGLRRGGSAPAP
jgi:uncharacterized membrane protein YeaQ/YmgE (transglycosylase-associated protein family)